MFFFYLIRSLIILYFAIGILLVFFELFLNYLSASFPFYSYNFFIFCLSMFLMFLTNMLFSCTWTSISYHILDTWQYQVTRLFLVSSSFSFGKSSLSFSLVVYPQSTIVNFPPYSTLFNSLSSIHCTFFFNLIQIALCSGILSIRPLSILKKKIYPLGRFQPIR